MAARTGTVPFLLPSKLSRRVTIMACAIVVLSLLLVSLPFAPELREARAQGYTIRPPIVINGDGDFNSANGVVSGTGSEGDPYVISGWEIRVTVGSGIAISNTAAHFIISDVHVNSTASAPNPEYAVYLFNVTNGQVKDSLLNNTPKGVYAASSSLCSVHHNQIYACNQRAVDLVSCAHFNVIGNDVLAANGVNAITVSECAVSLNRFNNSEMAINLWDAANVTVQQNLMISCDFAVSVSGGRDVRITGNDALAGVYGVYLSTCTRVNVSGNEVLGHSGSGMTTTGSTTDITFIYNRIMRSMYSGYMVEGGDSVLVRDNLFENNTVIFAFNGGGVTITSGSNLMFFHNNFVTNTNAQAQDPYGEINRWNETYATGGNYWSDYVGLDVSQGPQQNLPGSDGFGDTPYSIDTDSVDYYPLMGPYYLNSRPVALFTVTPPSGITGTTFQLDASSSSDPDEGCGDRIQKYRWDLDGDGDWDKGWSPDDNTSHVYVAPGNYTIILEVMDSFGLTSLYQIQLTVTGTVIPEFGDVLIPVIGLLVGCVAVTSRRRLERR